MTPSSLIRNFAVGQVYVCASEKPTRRLQVTIGKIDEFSGQPRVVSVAISDKGASGPFANVTHAPFDEQSLSECCVSLVAEGVSAPLGFDEGYQVWREAYDAGESGWFTISVEKLVDLSASASGSGEPVT